jgi:hypothetical protein
VYKPRILFVTYGGGHADIVARLWKELSERDNVNTAILAFTTAGSLFDRMSVPYRRVLEYLPMEGYEDALAVGEELSRGVWDPSSGVPESESRAYLGVSMLDLIEEKGRPAAEELYAQEGRRAFCPTRFMARVIEIERPDVVVATCSVRMELAALIEARRSGRVSVLVEDLFGFSMLGERALLDGQLSLRPEALPDHVVVMNEAVKRRIVAAGFPEHRAHALGQPVFSEWIRAYAVVPVAEQLASACQAGRTVLTYVATPQRDILFEQANVMLDLAERWPQRVVCIKLHPSVGKGEFRSRFPTVPENVVLLKDEDIVTVIKATSVAVVFRSTVGLLCLFSGTPFLILDTTGMPDFMPYASVAGVPKVEDYALLGDEIESLLAANRERIQTRNSLFSVVPDAAENIVSFLIDLASRSSGPASERSSTSTS